MFTVSVECAIEHNNKFLVIKRPKNAHAGGMLSFPAGKVEIHDGRGSEDVLMAAAKREVFEEIGLKLEDPLHYVSTTHFVVGEEKSPVIHTLFYCQVSLTTLDLKISEREVDECYWLTPEEIEAAENCPDWMVMHLNKLVKL